MGKLWTVLMSVAVAYAAVYLAAGVSSQALADEPVIVTGEVVAADGAVKVEKVKKPEKAEKGEAQDIRVIINGQEVNLGKILFRFEGDEMGLVCGGAFMPGLGVLAGEKKYGFLGVAPAPVPGPLADQLELADGRGVLLAGVEEGTPAAKAGLVANDVITQIDDQIIYSIEQLKKLVAARKPGSAVRVQFIHKSKPATATVELGGTAERSWEPRDGRHAGHVPVPRSRPGRHGGWLPRHGQLPIHGAAWAALAA